MRIFKTRSFNWWEMGLVKICLISLGILLGLYFAYYLTALLWLWWALFVVTGVYFIIRCIQGK